MNDKQVYDHLDDFQMCSFCTKQFEEQEITFQCLDCKKCILCADCFISDVPMINHQSTHRFFPLFNQQEIQFSDGMCLSDTLNLFTLIQTHGLNNWNKVRHNLGKQYSDDVLCKHFMTLCDKSDGLLKYFNHNKQNLYSRYEISEIQKIFRQQNQEQTIGLAKFPSSKDYSRFYSLSSDMLQNNNVLSQEQIKLQGQSACSKPKSQDLPKQISNVKCQEENKPFKRIDDHNSNEHVLYMNKIESTISYLHFNKRNFRETKESITFKLQVLQCFVFRLKIRKQLAKVINQKQNNHNIHDIIRYRIQDISNNTLNLDQISFQRQTEHRLRKEIFSLQMKLFMNSQDQINEHQNQFQIFNQQNKIIQNIQHNSIEQIADYMISYNDLIQEKTDQYTKDYIIQSSKFNKLHKYSITDLIVKLVVAQLPQQPNNTHTSYHQPIQFVLFGDLTTPQCLISLFCIEFLLRFEQNICRNTFKLLYDQDLLSGIKLTTNQLHRLIIWQEQLYEATAKVDIAKQEQTLTLSDVTLHFINKHFPAGIDTHINQINSKYQIRLIRQLIIMTYLQTEKDLDGYINFLQVTDRLTNLLNDLKLYKIFNQKHSNLQTIFGKIPELTDMETNIHNTVSGNKLQSSSKTYIDYTIKNSDKKLPKAKKNLYGLQYKDVTKEQQLPDDLNKQSKAYAYQYVSAFPSIIKEINHLGQELHLQKIHEDLEQLSVDDGLSIQGARNLTTKSILQYSSNKKTFKCTEDILQLLNQRNNQKQFRCQFNVKNFKVKQNLTLFDVLICALCQLNHNYFVQIKSYAGHRNWDVGSGLIHFLGGRTLLAEFLSYIWSQSYKPEIKNQQYLQRQLLYKSEIVSTFFAGKVNIQLFFMGAPVMQRQIEQNGKQILDTNEQFQEKEDKKKQLDSNQVCKQKNGAGINVKNEETNSLQQKEKLNAVFPDEYLVNTVVMYKQQIADSLLNKLRQILCP